MEAYKEWLLCGDDRTSAKCKVCPIPWNKIEVSNMGERAIKSHAKGKKHCDRLAPYIQSSCIKFMPVSKGSTESPGGSSTSTCSSTLDKFVVPDTATNTEIRWCLKNLMSSYSFRSCDGLADLFRSMFPVSTIAEKFCLQKDKWAYFINYGIAPYFHSILINTVKDSEFYAISFNESLNTHSDGTYGSCCKLLGQCCYQSVHLLSQFNFLKSYTTPRPFRALHFSIRFIGSKKAAAGICGWPQCELGLFLRITQLLDRKWHE